MPEEIPVSFDFMNHEYFSKEKHARNKYFILIEKEN